MSRPLEETGRMSSFNINQMTDNNNNGFNITSSKQCVAEETNEICAAFNMSNMNNNNNNEFNVTFNINYIQQKNVNHELPFLEDVIKSKDEIDCRVFNKSYVIYYVLITMNVFIIVYSKKTRFNWCN